MKDIPFTIRNFQSRKKVRLPLGEPVQLLKGLCEGIVWTAAPGQNQNQEPAKTVVVYFMTKLSYFVLGRKVIGLCQGNRQGYWLLFVA